MLIRFLEWFRLIVGVLFLIVFYGCASTSTTAGERIGKKVEKLTAQEVAIAEIPPKAVIYRIDKEDVLEVSVWRHPELSKEEVIVRPDGMISFPLVGDIQARGLTLVELKEKIAQGLDEFAQKRRRLYIYGKVEEERKYLIGLGDTLDISVWRIADLSREIIVRPDGMISFPLIGDLKAAGLTLVELDEKLTKALSDYVKNPQVSVMVKSFGRKREIPEDIFLEERPEVSVMIRKFGGKKVVVLGDVANPGVYKFTSDIRLAEAIALAGDCTKYAVKKNILVIRGNIHKTPQVITSDLIKFLKHADLSQNILIQPQDIVFVPRSFIGNINTFLESITPIVDSVYKSAVTQAAIETD